MPTFNYRKMESSLVGTIERPVAEILMESAEGEWIEFHPFIDSGADITIIPYSFGLMLGLSKDPLGMLGKGGVSLLPRLSSMTLGRIVVLSILIIILGIAGIVSLACDLGYIASSFNGS